MARLTAQTEDLIRWVNPAGVLQVAAMQMLLEQSPPELYLYLHIVGRRFALFGQAPRAEDYWLLRLKPEETETEALFLQDLQSLETLLSNEHQAFFDWSRYDLLQGFQKPIELVTVVDQLQYLRQVKRS